MHTTKLQSLTDFVANKSFIWMVIVSVTTLAPALAKTTPLSGESPHNHPIYAYSCNEDLTVTFRGVNGNVKVNEKGPLYSNVTAKDCKIEMVPDHYGNFLLSKDCLVNSSGNVGTYNEDRTAYVTVFDTVELENSTTGKRFHNFILTCLAIPDSGIEREAIAESGIKDMHELPHVYNEIGHVEMRFKKRDSIDSEDVSDMYIGDLFYMYIMYMGETKSYMLIPHICTAFKGTYRTSNSNNSVELWNDQNSASCLSNDASSYDVMQAFVRTNNSVVRAPMHGFKFKSSANEGDVTISCKVRICKSTYGTCNDNCDIKKRRKRRAVTTESSFKTVSKTYTIKDVEISNGSSVNHCWNLLLVIACILQCAFQ